MPARDPQERALVARIAANSRHAALSAEERRQATEAARRARHQKLAERADPDGRMTDEERERAVAQLQAAHMQRMTLRAMQARRRASEAASAAAEALEAIASPDTEPVEGCACEPCERRRSDLLTPAS